MKIIDAKRITLMDSSTMDEQIWKELPEELLEAVIARLPIAAFLRFRLISRKWNYLLKSHRFLQLYDQVSLFRNKLWLFSKVFAPSVVVREDFDIARFYREVYSGAIYDPCNEMWHHDNSWCTQEDIYPFDSIGGLICCHHFPKKCFIVGNPLTNNWKEFSSYRNDDLRGFEGRCQFGMVINNPRGYKIIKIYDGQYEVYDSLSTNNSPSCLHPTITGTIPDNITLMYVSRSSNSPYPPPVTVDSIVYFLTSNPQGILSYDSASGAWEVFPIPIPPNIIDLAIAECGGRILLMGLVRTNGAAYVSVWELQWTLLQWTEVDRMPNSWRWSYRGKWAAMRCIRNKGLLMMTLETLLKTERIFTYDAVKREWSEFPRFAIYGRRWLMGSFRGIAFFPSLSATP